MNAWRNKVTVVFMVVAILLPNCPCKVLSLFGINVRETISSSDYNQSSAELDVFHGSTFSLTCHYDDEDRTIDGPSVEVRESVTATHGEAYNLWSENDTFASQVATGSSKQRAPPDTQGNGMQTLSRGFLCVYLI